MAFTQATIVSHITIPSSVQTIEPLAFYGAGFLESITVDPANKNYSSVDGVLFNKDKTVLIQCPGFKDMDSYTVPSGVTAIADWSLGGFKTLVIPDSVITIGEFVGGGSYLSSLKLGNNITSIGNYSFDGCYVLQDVTIPHSVTYIGRNAFSDMGTMVDTSDTPLYSTVNATILNSAVQIEEGAFLNSPNLVLNGYAGSTAEQYANENGIAFSALKSGAVLGAATDVDTDKDGLPDDWEINGVTVNGVNLPLQEWGADPNIKDVFVEIDWMEGLKPDYADLLPVYEAFKKQGINLHVDAGTDSIDYVRNEEWGDASGGNELAYSNMFDLGTQYSNWKRTADVNLSAGRLQVFRHCLFVNRFDLKGASGTADTPGQIFIVAKGTIGNEDVPGTFMHELGHTLGLLHGGDQDGEAYNFKPNYLSVMNYSFQFGGLYGTGALDYSNYKLPDLNESSLDENMGVDPEGLTADAGMGTIYYFKGKAYKVPFVAYKKIDFNQNWKPGNTAYESAVSADINTEKGKSEMSPVLTGFNDWEYLLSEDWGAFENTYIGKLGAAKGVAAFEVNVPDELSETEVVELKKTLLEAAVVSSPEDITQKTISTVAITNIYSDMTDLETQQAFLAGLRSDKPALDLALENGDYLFKKYTDGGYDEVKDEAVVAKAQEITKNCKTDYEKLKAVHDWIAENIWYDLDDLNSNDRALDSMTDARGVLETGHSVCDGYSYLAKAMLNSLGIPTIRITGIVVGSPIGHAWNASFAEGRWIQFDATWDSQNRWKDGKKVNASPIKATHDYFDTTNNILDGHRFYWSNGAGLILHDNVVIAGSVGVGETSVAIPPYAVEIAERAFDTCPYLKEVSIPSGTKKIGVLAFVDCPSLNSVSLANGVEIIGDGAFSGCAQLTAIEFPESITSIGDSAFYGTGLKNVSLPGKITTVERFAFASCVNLESIFIPVGVTAINDAALGYINPDDGRNYYPTIYGNAGSYAEAYANEKGLDFVVGMREE